MSKEFIGLDVGTYSVKAFILDARDGGFRAFDEERIWPGTDDTAESSATAEAGATVPGDGEQTQIKPAPTGPEADGAEPGDTSDLGEDQTSEPWREALSTLLARHVFEEPRIATVMPGGTSQIIFTEVPFAEPNKVKSVLPHLLTDKIPVSLADVTYDFIVQPHGDAHEALIGYSPSSEVESYLEGLSQTNIDPVALTNPELMLASAGISRDLGSNGPVAIIDLGHENTRVVVIDQSNILLARRIQRGGAQITEALAEAFKVEFPEAERIKHEYAAIVDSPPNDQMKVLSESVVSSLGPIVRDLRRSFQSLLAKRKVSIERVYLCGGTSQLRNIDKFLTSALGVEVAMLPIGLDADSPAGAMCQALSKSLGGNALDINLRTGAFTYRGRSSYVRRQAYFLTAGVFIILLAVVGALFIQKAGHEARRDAMKSTLEKHTQKLFGEKLTSKAAITRRLAGEEGDSQGFVPKLSAYELMYNVTKSLTPATEIKLTRFEVDVDRQIVQFMGETSDAQAVDTIVSDLEKVECVKEIRKDKLKLKTDGRADFELQISTDCS